ncbi:MAG: MBL fold metallo-hydrolase [Leptospira sp.]|nr:MBL fold metallo-hydrolase [Leptospira sp.]
MLNEFEHKGIELKGYSEGGIRTSIIWPALNAMFDMGNSNPDQVQYQNLFLTHSHSDHFAGTPYYVSQRSLKGLPKPNIYLPVAIHEKVDRLFKLYSELEEYEYKYNLIPAKIGEEYVLNKQYSVMPLPTFHRVVSQGYTVLETRSKLKPEFMGLKGPELKEKKDSGIEIETTIKTPVFSFSGDTKIEYVLENEAVQKSKILFLECTYLDNKRNVERAREWGHIHLDEIIQNAKYFQNEKLVLIHFSQRYRYKEIREFIRDKVPKELMEKIHIFIPSKKQ